MKIITKYEYKLTDQLDKDIDKFIRAAKRGTYEWDYKYGSEGLKTIKQYFRFIQEEFEKENYELSLTCYKKMLKLMFGEGFEQSYFFYEDIVDRSKLNFDKILENYVRCIMELRKNVTEIFNEYVEYVNLKYEYDFDIVNRKIIEKLDLKDLEKFKGLVEKKAETLTEKDYSEHEFIFFLLDLAKHKKDKKEYYKLAQKYHDILGSEEEEIMQEFEEQD